MMKKYIFFDIDGTLTNANPGGTILPSTLRTLRKLEENGHFVAIATGRSYTMARTAMIETGITNVVCCGGNGLVVDNKLLYIHPIERDKALKIINELKEKKRVFGIKIDDSDNMYSYSQDFAEKVPEALKFSKVHYLGNDHYERIEEFHKIFVHYPIDTDERIESLKETGMHYARYHSMSVVIEPDDKYKGILDMIKMIGGKEEDIVVFGDGHNDLSMMKQAPMGIAMGNAIEELKQCATFVTKDCSENGIEYACEYFGWI